ncbi:MAG: YfhO family protein [Bacilli bacterium]|nr:YfhO family protein [Bacilli bacterium]
MSKIKTVIQNIRTWFSAFTERTFSDRKKTFKLIALLVFTVLFLIQMYIIIVRNSFYNCVSDDILQYYTVIVDFISGLKDGTVSWFNLNNYFGASLFADAYYVPIDIFTGITFLLSYVMPTEVAYSSTELFKILASVMIMAYYLNLKGMKNRTIFWMSILYFISGGTVSFMVFPVFSTLSVYMPLALIIIHFFIRKKKWLVPLFAFAMVFYDFYLGYTMMAFTAMAFLIEYIKEPNFKFFRFVLDSLIFVGLLVLGVLMAAIILAPSVMFILEDAYVTYPSFDSWTIAIFGHDLELFTPNIYIRIIAKIFAEQIPTGFYGLEKLYPFEHFSLYISIIGFVYMNYIFFMKDKVSRIYKVAILFGIIFMIFPIFSYVFSGSLESPYTRWINMYSVFQIMILAHVFDKFGFENVKMKYMTKIIVPLLLILSFVVYYYIFQLRVDSLLTAGTLNAANIKDYYLADPILSTLFGDGMIDEMMIATSGLNARQALTADTVFMAVSAVYMLVLLIFGWLKKWTVIKGILWVEIILAIGYTFAVSFNDINRITTFQNEHDIQEYLDTVLDNESFYRIYIDINGLDVSKTNINRMTGYATNSGEIFFSWNDKETDDFPGLLLGKWTEPKASKKVLNYYSYYVTNFLGYKYILVDAESNYSFDSIYFDLIAGNDTYRLYEIVNSSPFMVYESFLTYNEFTSYRLINSQSATEQLLLVAAVIDTERYAVEEMNLEQATTSDNNNVSESESFNVIENSTIVERAGVEDETVRTFYRYSNTDLNIEYILGAVYFNSFSEIHYNLYGNLDSNYLLDLLDYGEVFMEFADGSTKACWVQPGQSHQIKCEFFETPIAIYIEDTSAIDEAPSLQIRQEAAFNAAAYLVYDLSQLNLSSDSGVIQFSFNNLTIGKAFVMDEFGNKYNCLEGFYTFNTIPEKLYIFKTSDMYNYSNLFDLTLKAAFDDLSVTNGLLNEDFVSSKYMTIKNGIITLEYTNTSNSTYDQVVIVPVTYSEEWIITSPVQYETMSVSGGFLGIVIPNGTTEINITLKFIPKGLDVGALGSAAGILIYLGIFLPGWIKKRKKGVDPA